MGFRRLFIGADVPAGDIRLLGCGGGDGFSILPDPRNYCLMSALPDPQEDRRLRQSPFYRHIARPSQVRPFWRSVPQIRQHLRQASGCLFHIGFGEHPLRTLATFSLWQDAEQMRAFASQQSPHHRTLRAARQEDWLSESLFVRFRALTVSGDLDDWPLCTAPLASIQH